MEEIKEVRKQSREDNICDVCHRDFNFQKLKQINKMLVCQNCISGYKDYLSQKKHVRLTNNSK